MIDSGYSKPTKYAKNFQFDLRRKYPYVKMVNPAESVISWMGDLPQSKYIKAIIWCRLEYQDRITEYLGTFWFQNEEDRLRFLLRWS